MAGGIISVWLMFQPAQQVFLGYAVLDPFSSFLSLTLCVGLGLAALSAAGFLHRRGAERGEFYALMMFATAGMSLLAISNELITVFVQGLRNEAVVNRLGEDGRLHAVQHERCPPTVPLDL